jgi:hypothetical protein
LIKPVGLVAAHYPSIRDRVFQRFPFMRSSAFERRMLFEHPGQATFIRPPIPQLAPAIAAG